MNSILQTTLIVLLSVVLLVPGSHPAAASQGSEADFVPSYQFRKTTLALRGVGVLKYLGIIRIYKAALYLPPQLDSGNVPGNVAKHLEVKYLRPFKAEDIGAATIAGVKKNVDDQTYRRLKSRIDYHNSLYVDIAARDRLSLTYLPSIGTRLEINGKVRGTIKGADFARALFSIWLGENPLDEGFKQALLGEK